MKYLIFIFLLLLAGCREDCGCEEQVTPVLPPNDTIINVDYSSRVYKGDDLNFTYNGEIVTDAEIAYDSINVFKGAVILKQIIPFEDSVRLEVAFTQRKYDLFSFQGRDSTEMRTIAVTGTVKEGKLQLTATFKMTTPVTGDWELYLEEFAPNERAFYMYVKNSMVDSITLPVCERIEDSYVQKMSLESWMNWEHFKYCWVECPNLKDDGTFTSYIAVDNIIDMNGYYRVSGDTVFLFSDNRTNKPELDAILAGGIPIRWKYRYTKDNPIIAMRVNKEEFIRYFFPFILDLRNRVSTLEVLQDELATPESMVKYMDDVMNLISTSEEFEVGFNMWLRPKHN